MIILDRIGKNQSESMISKWSDPVLPVLDLWGRNNTFYSWWMTIISNCIICYSWAHRILNMRRCSALPSLNCGRKANTWSKFATSWTNSLGSFRPRKLECNKNFTLYGMFKLNLYLIKVAGNFINFIFFDLINSTRIYFKNHYFIK